VKLACPRTLYRVDSRGIEAGDIAVIDGTSWAGKMTTPSIAPATAPGTRAQRRHGRQRRAHQKLIPPRQRLSEKIKSLTW